MYGADVKNGINQFVAIFQCAGLWDVEGVTAYSKKWKLFLILFYATFPVSLGIGAYVTDDKEETIFLLATSIASAVQVFRLIYIIYKRSDVLTFMHQVSSHDIENQNDFGEIHQKVQLFLKFAKYLLSMVSFVMVTASIFYASSGEKMLPLNIAFPWKNTATGYWMAFTFLTIQCIFSIIIFSYNVLIWYLMLSFAMEYELLGNQFRRMGSVRPTQKRKISETEKQIIYLQDLIAAIELHQTIRKTIKQFEYCFSKLFFIQIATSSLGLCGSVYTLAFISHENLIQSLIYSLSLVYFIFDIFLITYLGNEITLTSDRLSYSLFESNWMDQSRVCKKCIIIFSELLQRPHDLVVGYIYPLNLETFRRILNLAYNMFNILQNIN